MSYGIIYKAVCPMGKVYVGQTVKSLAMRKSQHKYRALKGDKREPIQVAILEHGFSAFTWSIIDIFNSPKELETKEKYWIDYYKSDNPEYGYNGTAGGIRYSPNAETRRKSGEARKGEKHYLFGKSIPKETRIKMSEARKGKIKTLETRKKMSEARKGNKNPNFGKKANAETRRKMSISHRGEKSHKAKLTDVQVKEIKIALANGESCASLARKYSVVRAAISNIKHGKSWSWLKVGTI